MANITRLYTLHTAILLLLLLFHWHYCCCYYYYYYCYYYYFIGKSINELPKVSKRSRTKRNLIAKIKILNELSYYLMDPEQQSLDLRSR